MKIAFISTGGQWGGSEELWAESALKSLEAGHEVLISIHPNLEFNERLTRLKKEGAKVFYNRPTKINLGSKIVRSIRWRFFDSKPFTPVEKRSPFRHLFSEKPSVICINQGGAYNFLRLDDLIELLNINSSIPYIVICHGTIEYKFLSDSNRDIVKKFFSRAYKVAFVSDRSLEVTERQLAQHLLNSIILRNPVNLSSFEIVSWNYPEIINFASVARFEVYTKSHDILLEVLSKDSWRERKWKLNLYGQGADEKYIKDLVKFYDLVDKVNFKGHVTDIRKVWEENQLLVMPSRIEGIPLALVEAMICGRPSVVTDVAGNLEWVSEPESGFIAEAPTNRYFGAALERTWQKKDQWEKIGINAHKSAMSKIDRDSGKTLLKLLESVEDGRHGQKAY